MKTALILHGTGHDSKHNWFPWLKTKLEKVGYQVWVPDLPQADKPSISRYNQFILANKNWPINSDTILIGHSSGAVAILGLLQALPENVTVKACYLVSAFRDDLGWEALSELFVEPFDFEKIKSKSRSFYFIHSDNDPYCDLSHAQYLHEKIGGDLLVLPGQKHFSVSSYGEKYRQFPYLYNLITGDVFKPTDVVEFYQTLDDMGVKIWFDGGWGIDALLGKKTRSHADIDIVIEQKNVPTLNKLLTERGYREISRGDSSWYNYVIGDEQAGFIDIHVININDQGDGIYGSPQNGFKYPKEALSGVGEINNQKVRCISPEWAVKFHTGYKLRESDFHDVLAVCEKFKIEVPEEYRASQSLQN